MTVIAAGYSYELGAVQLLSETENAVLKRSIRGSGKGVARRTSARSGH